MTDIEQLLRKVSPSVRSASAYDASRPQCLVRLDGNESPFRLSAELRRELLDRIAEVALNRYPDPDCSALREAVSEQNGVSPDCMVFGNGSDELIQMAVSAFCGGTGTVLVPTPTFSMYEIASEISGRKVVREKLDGAFDLDEDAMLKAIETARPDVVFLASPNSPTGNLLSPERMESVIARARGIVIVDEAYSDFCGRTYVPLMKKYQNLAVMRTFSKIGFAGIRLGVIFMRPELAAELSKVRLPYNINSFTQAAVRVFFENISVFEANVETIKSERKKMSALLGSVDGIKLFPSDANFFLIRFPDARAASEIHRKLIEKSVLVRKFPGTDISDCLRVTIGLPEENRQFETALRDIVSAVL